LSREGGNGHTHSQLVGLVAGRATGEKEGEGSLGLNSTGASVLCGDGTATGAELGSSSSQ
jgi:hypothetical protein